jgi:UDPglucose 6-dehydrogenase
MANKLEVEWDKALEGFVSDPRIGNSHTQVPGHDGKLGFGGTCFPKDINALITLGKELGVNMNTLEAAWETNLEVRPEQDWKDLKGRAVS